MAWTNNDISDNLTNQIKMTIRTWLSVAGGVCLSLFLYLPNHPKSLNLMGWIGLLSGYFLWLKNSYKRKETLYMRGGAVIYRKHPALYKFIYLLGLLVGIFVVFILLLEQFSKH